MPTTIQHTGVITVIGHMTLRPGPSPTVGEREELGLLGKARRCPLTRGIKTSLGYFPSPVLAEGRAVFGKTQGSHPTDVPSQRGPRTGPCPGQSELPVSCLTAWHWTQEAELQGESGLAWEDATGRGTHSTLPIERLPECSEKGRPGSTKAHVFLVIHSFIQQSLTGHLLGSGLGRRWGEREESDPIPGSQGTAV